MDDAVTNIFGIILGAVLYFLFHTFFLAITNPFCLVLLPFIILGMEMVAKYYRNAIRETHRMCLVSMSPVYQAMAESIICRATVCAFGSTQRILCLNLEGLDVLQRLTFVKSAVIAWLGLRMSLIASLLNSVASAYPILQYFGYVPVQSAALVGFSINYAKELTNIIQQFVTNFSDMEMQLISIERLLEYSTNEDTIPAPLPGQPGPATRGLTLRNVTVSYRAGIRPALMNVSLAFHSGEVTAVVGRTGAGKSTLLLSMQQLVSYQGEMWLDGELLAVQDGKRVRQRLVGTVPQTPVLFSGNLRMNLDLTEAKDNAALMKVLESVGLQGLAAGPLGLNTPLAPGNEDDAEEAQPNSLLLSQGQKQLLSAARVLLRRPRVVLLDEVTSCLEPALASSVLGTLLEQFKQIEACTLLVTHQDDLRKKCDRAVTIAEGRVLSDVRL